MSRESDAALLQSMPSGSSTAAEHAIALCLRKRAFDNMSVADQLLLEDFDTERLHKRRRLIVADRLPSFRSQVSSASAAAEHANYQ